MEYEVVRKVCGELYKLTEDIQKLDDFMHTDEYLKLNSRHQDMLSDQLDIMYDYARVLGRRIEDLT